MKRILLVLIALLIAFSVIGCGEAKKIDNTMPENYQEIGAGEKSFMLTVTDKDKSTESFLIHTDKEYVGEALTELNIVEGEDSIYGLYIKKVNGITADFEKDKTYWAFYIDGEYAVSGVDKTPIEENKVYSLRIEK